MLDATSCRSESTSFATTPWRLSRSPLPPVPALIRVNVLTGLMNTDQGPIVGQAAEGRPASQECAPDVNPGRRLREACHPSPGSDDSSRLGSTRGSEAVPMHLIVSGSGTGLPADPDDGRRLRKAVADARFSSVRAPRLANLRDLADVRRRSHRRLVLETSTASLSTRRPRPRPENCSRGRGVGWIG